MTRLVSVCIPTRNGARWIAGTIASVLEQDVDLDVVISDDASTDATVEIASSTRDARLRVVPASSRLGMAGNWNRAIALSSGTFLKLLMQDDELLPGALERQIRLLEAYPSAGLAFGPRVLEGDGSPAADWWIAKFGSVQEALSTQRQLLDGSAVVRTLTRRRLRGNAIGEPSIVLMRRDMLDQAGLFNPDLLQLTDLDLWLRIATRSDLAFDPLPVAKFRVHRDSATTRNRLSGDAWLDRLRIIDSLAHDPRTSQAIGASHYAAAIAGGVRDVMRGLVNRRRSLAATTRELRRYLHGRTPHGLAA